MELRTERLLLRPVGKKNTDLKDILEGCNDLKVTKWLLVLPHPYTKKDALSWINHCKNNQKKKDKTSYEFSIELKSEKKVIGGIGLSSIKKDQGSAVVGYWLNSKYHKKGYGSEALKVVLEFAFGKLKLRRIEAGVYVGNPSSGKLLEKFGAKQEGYKRKAVVCKATGKVMDELIYGLLKEDWKKTIQK